MRKRRLLMVNEASFLATGYSVYGYEVQKRLFASGKYEVAELACYDDGVNPKRDSVPWKLYPNEANRTPEFDRDPTNQFGKWTFNDVCLDFKPDVVWDIRDPWMADHQETSPFRDLFHWAIMPTVDAVPQKEQWLSTYSGADAVLCYTDWAVDVLKREGGGLIRPLGAAPPGADTETFAPMDRKVLRAAGGFEDDIFVVGTVMRNQPRKLYPDLIEAFAHFQKVADPALARKTYLYLHTSYPDMGWDLPELIKNSGVARRILVTYRCRNCLAVAPQHFQDAIAVCQRCGASAAALPNLNDGLDRATLAKIINNFDVYVQYATNEGFGMPQVEAAACGVPVFATDYSAMSDVVRKVKGYPIKCRLYREADFGRFLARPDRDDFVNALIRHLSLPESDRIAKGKAARRAVLDHYTWDKAADAWMAAFDSLPLRDESQTWGRPSRAHTPPPVPKQFETHEQLVRWAVRNVLGRPDLADGYMALRLIRDLNWQVKVNATAGYQNENCMLGIKSSLTQFSAEDMLAELHAMNAEFNSWEEKRCRQK